MTGGSPSAFVDAHCHIDLFPLPEQIVEQAEAHRIYTIAVTNAPSVFAHTAGLASGSKYIRPAIGLHPELVHSHSHELDQFRSHLAHTRYVGEVGLDYTTSDHEVRLLQRHHSRHFLETRRRQRLLHPLDIRGGQQLAISAIEQFTNQAMREPFSLCARHPWQHTQFWLFVAGVRSRSSWRYLHHIGLEPPLEPTPQQR